MDPISITSSVIAVIELTGAVLGYISETKDASADHARLAEEVTSILGLLTTLKFRVQAAKKDGQLYKEWFSTIRSLNIEKGPLDQFQQALLRLASKLEPKEGIRKAAETLRWKFKKPQIYEILDAIERLKSLINLALTNYLFTLTHALKNDQASSHDYLTIQLVNLTDQVEKYQLRLEGHIAPIAEGVTNLQLRADVQDNERLQQQAQRRRAGIAEWLSTVDQSEKHIAVSRQRQEGTGEWVLEEDKFKSWVDGANPCLWCPGIPGAGKTVLASFVIDHLNETFRDESVAVAYWWISYEDPSSQSSERILRNLLSQILLQAPSATDELDSLYDANARRKMAPRLPDYVSAFYSQSKNFQKVYIVVDALDELCDAEDRQELIEALQGAPPSVKWLVTCRTPAPIEAGDSPSIDIVANANDVRAYVKARMSSEWRFRAVLGANDGLRKDIIDTVLASSKGM
jgi:Cdc6-like AAA superfamily ATPase